ncbi:hypothetical protein SERLADRAFT_346990, partial [Serpula lacrymans var. lacrymans S7.9]
PEIYLDKIQDWLVLAHDVHTSKTALFKNIRDAGLTYKILQKTASDRDNDLREEWLQDINTHFTARQFIMIDETNKNDWTIYQYYGQAPKGRRAMVQANFVWGEHYGPGAALTLDGYLSAMDIFHITVNGKDFFDFCFKQYKNIIILSSCAIHKLNALQEVIESIGCMLISLPPYSPDLNPIRESFSCGMVWSF